jgi:hypothetical protein
VDLMNFPAKLTFFHNFVKFPLPNKKEGGIIRPP